MADTVKDKTKLILAGIGSARYFNIYLSVIHNNLISLALNEKKTTLDNILVSYFWDVIEKNITSKTIGTINQNWNYDTLFDTYKIHPVLNYIPSEDVERHISPKKLSEYLTPSLDLFLADDNVKISLTESIRFRNAKNRL